MQGNQDISISINACNSLRHLCAILFQHYVMCCGRWPGIGLFLPSSLLLTSENERRGHDGGRLTFATMGRGKLLRGKNNPDSLLSQTGHERRRERENLKKQAVNSIILSVCNIMKIKMDTRIGSFVKS